MKDRSKLPTWVILGACALACIAGMVNVIGLLGFVHQGLTHLTGITTLLGASIAQLQWRAVWEISAVILAFLAGCVLSGFIIQDDNVSLRRRYGVALAIESALLFLAAALFREQDIKGALIAATAMGLQNAMATTYSGALVRTTHVSGLFTDVGIAIGHALRGEPFQIKRVQLSVLTIGAFLFGSVTGAWLFQQLHYHALYVPAVWTGVVGVGYALYHHFILQRKPA